MKPYFLFIILLAFGFAGHAQFNQDAPWMKSLNTEERRGTANPVTFDEMVDAFNTYWADKDPNVRGSGYKPFKRWENYWQNFVKEDGTLPTQAEYWEAWNRAKMQRTQAAGRSGDSNWIPQGPFEHTNTGSWSSGQGRINAVMVDPNNPNTYYAGAPAGGIWKSVDAGTTWQPLSDFLPQIGVSGIAVDYNNSDIIYIATGDDDAGDSYSVGVMKSTDGGQTWNNTGLNPQNSPTSMNDIYMHPGNSNILWVATNNGIYKTTNAGATWTNVQTGNMKDLKVHPTNPNILYAVTPNTFYKSVDGGNTFSNVGVGVGLPTGTNRLVIDVTPANPQVIYVLAADTDYSYKGLYKSTNAGLSFVTASTSDTVGDIFESSQAWFDMAMAVSDSNEHEVYVGVLNIWKSSNSGTNFTKLNYWNAPYSAAYTHADIHLLRFYNGQLFAGTDGGIYKSTNGGSNFTDLTAGIQNGQFYKIAVSRQTASKMVGGLQDNGGYALNNAVWQNYYGADGMDTAIDPSNENLYFGFIQNGGSLYISTTGGSNLNLGIASPSGENGNWVTPLVMNSESELYSGYSRLYKLCGSKWESVSTYLGGNIDKLEIDDLNPDIIFVAIDNFLLKSTDRGNTFVEVEDFPTHITSIEVNTNNSNIVYVTTSGFNGRVYKSVDGGMTFSNITGNLPTGTKNVVKHQSLHSAAPIFVGTSFGVYRYDEVTAAWETFNTNLPVVSVTDLEINTNEGVIIAATYGRGIWKSAIPVEANPQEVGIQNILGIDNALVCGDIQNFQVELINTGSANLTEATITHTILGDTQVTNWTGNLAPGATEIADISRTITGNATLKELEVSVSTTLDGYASNSKLVKRFNNTTQGQVNVVNTFETQNEALIVYDGLELSCGYWQRGIPTGTILNSASSGTQVYGTNLSGNHDNEIKSYLVSNCYNLTTVTNPVLRFNMAFDLEFNWDIVYVEYSVNSGETWQVLGTAADPNWYNSNTPAGQNNTCYNCPGAQWTGTSPFMQEYSYSLSPFTGESSFMVRFVFHSDQAVVQEGVILDDFVIEGTLNTQEFPLDDFQIYPNPSSGIFTIMANTGEDMQYNLFDVTGKEIQKGIPLKGTNLKHPVDLSAFQSGVYFIQVYTSGQSVTKKIIKQ